MKFIKLNTFNRNDITRLGIQAKVSIANSNGDPTMDKQNEYLLWINLEAYILLIDPTVEAALPDSRALREPQSNFLVGTINRIASMDNVPAH